MPKKQKQLARDSAILAKLLSNNVIVIDQLKFEKPKTKDFATILNNLKIDRSCLVVIGEHDDTLWRSARNIPKVSMMPAAESNAGDICKHTKAVIYQRRVFVAYEQRIRKVRIKLRQLWMTIIL